MMSFFSSKDKISKNPPRPQTKTSLYALLPYLFTLTYLLSRDAFQSVRGQASVKSIG